MVWPDLVLHKDKIAWLFIHEGYMGQRVIFVDDLRRPLDIEGWRNAVREMQRMIASEL